MRPWHLVCATAVIAGLTGCFGVPVEPCEIGGVTVESNTPSILDAGIAVTVHIEPSSFGCRGTSADLTASAEVFSPANLPLENQVSFAVVDRRAGFNVSFSTGEPGPYFVRLTPNRGAVVQKTFHVIRDRDDVATFQGVTSGCLEIDRLNDVLVCSEPGGTLVELFDGGVRNRRPSAGVTVSSKSLWSWAPSGVVTVFGTDGGQLIPLAETPLERQIFTGAVIPFTDDVLLYATNALIQVRVDGGVLETETSRATNALPASEPSLALSRDCLIAIQGSFRELAALCRGDTGSAMGQFSNALHLEGNDFWVRLEPGTTPGLATFRLPEGREPLFPNPGSLREGMHVMASSNLVMKNGSVPFALVQDRAVLFSKRSAEFHRFALDGGAVANGSFIWQKEGSLLAVQQR